MMNSLKKQMKELKSSLQDREAELVQLKRNIKVTKLEEVEVELKGYIEESIRLRSLLDQALRNQAAQKMLINYNDCRISDLTDVEEKFYLQMKVINSLQQDIDNINSLIKVKDEDIFNLRV